MSCQEMVGWWGIIKKENKKKYIQLSSIEIFKKRKNNKHGPLYMWVF